MTNEQFARITQELAQAVTEAQQSCVQARLEGIDEFEQNRRLRNWFALHDRATELAIHG